MNNNRIVQANKICHAEKKSAKIYHSVDLWRLYIL